MEHVRYLEIPVSDIDRYLPLADRFKALSEMKSVLDRRLFDAHINLDDLTPEQHAILTQQRDERTKHLDQMVLFVLELRQLHKNVLQTASCSGESSRTLRKKLSHFATKIGDTNLSAVTYIMPPRDQQGALGLP
ncbi:hypothetical protein BGZ97_012595 [Linnemannia gamsii]|uniref:Uncharacterized protein n=1 Tax=Linnemannia gamsii TaxID=64522 RepID=A0A9P6UKE2_9FUNG|nr:hypothetical protein BGZ97_012595 [Linnemannia gamsii]